MKNERTTLNKKENKNQKSAAHEESAEQWWARITTSEKELAHLIAEVDPIL